MSDEPSESTTPHEPFSLRELFLLTTLAGVSLALTLNFEWTGHERWFLGLSLGGTLLGIAIARVWRKSQWIAGVAAGTLGGLIAVGIMGFDWLTTLTEFAASGGGIPGQLDGLRYVYTAGAATTLAFSAIIAVLGVSCFQFLAWGLDIGEQGMAAAARRHPYHAAASAAAVVLLVLGAANFDFLRDPYAWPHRHFIPFPRQTIDPWQIARGKLSRSGDWLTIHRPKPSTAGDWELYRLASHPHRVQFTNVEQAAFLAFDCDQDRLAYVDYQPRGGSSTIHIIDLTTWSDTIVPETTRHGDLHSLQWMPGGTLVIHYGSFSFGKQGHTILSELDRGWSRHDSVESREYHPHCGKFLERTDEGVRMVDLNTSREIASFSKEQLDEMLEGLGGDSSAWLTPATDGRFLLAGSKIYDLQLHTCRDWKKPPHSYFQPSFYGFTPRGYALFRDAKPWPNWLPLSLSYVPFGSRIIEWLMRQPIRLIDPATGESVANTLPIGIDIAHVTISHDGSRMAVFNPDGIYVFDVPEEFR